MSAAWGATESVNDTSARAKRFIRLWGYLAIAGAFLVFCACRLGINLF